MPVVAISDETSEAKREQRSERFKAVLRRHGIAEHGAQTAIAKAVGVSDATVAAWMRGSMPRDPEVLFRFCDVYDVDPYWWTSGQSRPRDSIDSEKLVRSFMTVNQYKEAHNLILTAEQTALLTANVYDDPAGAQSYLEKMAPFFAS
jgi:transcriptional regulator with XRE-family HTH domain